MYFGAAYYPEHWPEERWAVDAELMQRAGVNGVRMGEFAWSAVEAHPGRFEFGWLDRAIELLGEHGIRTMMCTCSRTPPPWVFHTHPEILNVRKDGQRSNYGVRYTVCHNNPTFQRLAQRIDLAFIEHYADNDNVVMWHIDNEIGSGNTCYCAVCHDAFVRYLQDKYDDIEKLNDAWGRHFWSFAFSDFNDVPLPNGVYAAAPALSLEYDRFVSACNVGFAKWRYDQMKTFSPGRPVTTNFQQHRAEHTDIFDMGRYTDVYGTNLYPPGAPELAIDYCRGTRGQLLILEQRSGQPHWSSATVPGWMRLWAWRSIAHGANGINFFRWRPCRWGQEEYWHGVLPHSGRVNRRYRELCRMGRELSELSSVIEPTRPSADVAVVMSYESRWAINAVLHNQDMRVQVAAQQYHDALMRLNVTVDAFDPRQNLSRYRLVIAPRLYCVPDAVAANLESYVRGGGILCLTPRSGVVDEFNTVFNVQAPGPLTELAGVEVDDYGALDQPVPLTMDGCDGAMEARVWCDEIIVTTAEVVARYAGGWQTEMPAITINRVGAGTVVYVGTVLQGDSLAAYLTWLLNLAGCTGAGETVAPAPDENGHTGSTRREVCDQSRYSSAAIWSSATHRIESRHTFPRTYDQRT